MLFRSNISFRSGDLLRKEMLEDMYNYPRMVLESYYCSYSDGILYGLECVESSKGQGHHVIKPGALKLNGQIYFLDAETDIEDYLSADLSKIVEKDNSSVIKRRLFFLPTDKTKEPSIEYYRLELKLIKKDEMEEAKLKGYYYAYIEYSNDDGLNLIDDKNEIYGLYSAIDGNEYAFSPSLVKERIVPIIDKKDDLHPMDYMLINFSFYDERLSIEFIKRYIMEYYRQNSMDSGSVGKIFEGTTIDVYNELIKACEGLHGVHQIVIKDKEIKETKEEIEPLQGSL